MVTITQAADLLRAMDNVAILTHIRPDGDTVGSAAGLCATLRALGKTAYLLPNSELTQSVAPYAAPYLAPEGFVPTNVVSTDIAAVQLFPENALPYLERIDLAIDHHPSFEGFGKAQLVDASAAACGEIIFQVSQELTPLTPEIALPLYLAIATDTGCFVYTNTKPRTHEIAGKLMAVGIDHQKINKDFFQTKSRKRMQLEGAMLDSMTFHDDGRVVILAVPLSLMARFDATEYDAEDLSSLGPMIEGTDCAVTMRERKPGLWKFSVRAGKRINASHVCAVLGGGGHAAAAGCAFEGNFEDAKQAILDAIVQNAPDFKA